MRPILLKGHTRSITFVRFNRDGDLLFTASKDHSPTLWRATTGERIGTYDGHTGTVWHLDVTPDSTLLLTASADQTARLWSVETGICLFTWPHSGTVRAVALSEGETSFATVNDPFGAEVPAAINLFDFAAAKEMQSVKPKLVIVDSDAPRCKVTRLAWTSVRPRVGQLLLAAYETGAVRVLDPESGGKLAQWSAHGSTITSLSFDVYKSLLLTSSTDRTAKLWDLSKLISEVAEGEPETPTPMKTFVTDTPVNAAVLAPGREIVVLGGGQEAMEVTTTSAGAGKFESRFFHMVFEHELGRIKGHFGPINSLAFNPDGRSFASGAEDGYIRLHHLDAAYDRLGVDDELESAELQAALDAGELETLEAEEAANRRRAKAAADAAAEAMASSAARV